MDLKDRSRNYVKFIIYLIVIVLMNLAGITLFFRMDMTANKIYSISEASKRVVSTLSEPLTINVFFTKNLPAPHNNTERYLHDLLEEYSIYANRYFNYRFYDVSPEEGDISQEAKKNQQLAKNYGIYPVQIRVIEQDEVKFQKAYMGLVLIHGDMIERVPTIGSTEGLEYELTTAIQKLNNKISALLSLQEKIQIKLFLSSSLESIAPYMRIRDLPQLPAKLEDIVKRLNAKNYGKLELEHLDPTQDKDLEAALKKYNILKLRWPALSGGKIQPGQGAAGLVMEHGGKWLTIPIIHVLRVPLIGTTYKLANLNELEEIVNESVESLIDINEDLGYLADHGTLEVSASSPADPMRQQRRDELSSFGILVSQNYTIKDVDLKDGSIPESVNCLVIARPTETFTDYELFQIDQFLMRGKSLALFLDSFKEVEPPKQQAMALRMPSYVPFDTGLEKLLEHYGIRVKKSYVMDENCYRQRIPARFGGGERPIYFAPLIKSQSMESHLGFMKNIKGLVVMKISPLELNTQRITENGLQAHKLFSSSGKSWEMSGRINLNPMFIQPPQSPDEQKSLPLAYILEGEFPSFFAGKPIPEREPAEGDPEKKEEDKALDEKLDVDLSKIESESEFLTRAKPGKIFLMASSEVLKDNMLDEEGKSPNAMFILNVLDFLNDREAFATMRSKEQRFNPLDDTKVGTRTFVKSFNIAGLPVLVVILGLLVWFGRHSRKKRIQLMFQK